MRGSKLVFVIDGLLCLTLILCEFDLSGKSLSRTFSRSMSSVKVHKIAQAGCFLKVYLAVMGGAIKKMSSYQTKQRLLGFFQLVDLLNLKRFANTVARILLQGLPLMVLNQRTGRDVNLHQLNLSFNPRDGWCLCFRKVGDC